MPLGNENIVFGNGTGTANCPWTVIWYGMVVVSP
jgi:hypothetical protein